MEREKFYHSKIWKTVRKNVWLKQSCLCARCGRPVWINGISDASISRKKRLKGIVHHKIYLDDKNVNDSFISLNEENLEGLCIVCHNAEHFKTNAVRKDVMFDEDGNLISIQNPPHI